MIAKLKWGELELQLQDDGVWAVDGDPDTAGYLNARFEPPRGGVEPRSLAVLELQRIHPEVELVYLRPPPKPPKDPLTPPLVI